MCSGQDPDTRAISGKIRSTKTRILRCSRALLKKWDGEKKIRISRCSRALLKAWQTRASGQPNSCCKPQNERKCPNDEVQKSGIFDASALRLKMIIEKASFLTRTASVWEAKELRHLSLGPQPNLIYNTFPRQLWNEFSWVTPKYSVVGAILKGSVGATPYEKTLHTLDKDKSRKRDQFSVMHQKSLRGKENLEAEEEDELSLARRRIKRQKPRPLLH